MLEIVGFFLFAALGLVSNHVYIDRKIFTIFLIGLFISLIT
jgi:hypothetical protein